MSGRYSNFFRKKGERIVCTLCRHYCSLPEGGTGICGVNRNSGGVLETLVYGRVSAINIDPVEKKPLYHFLPSTSTLSIGTVGCNFRCPFCQNWSISQTSDMEGSYEISPSEIVNLAIEKGCGSIAYTYNEPTIFYPFARDVAVLAKSRGLKNIFVSNGFETVETIEDMRGVIDAFNIDLKSFDRDYYKKVLKGDLDAVLDTLAGLKKGGFWVEVTTLIVPGDNDSDEELEAMAEFISREMGPETPWHLSAFHPDYKVTDRRPTSIRSLYRAMEIGREKGLYYIYPGNVAIDAVTVCPGCGMELIVRRGFEVVTDNLERGECPGCHRRIEGVWGD